MLFVEIQGIYLDSVSPIIKYYFCKLAALKKPKPSHLAPFSLVHIKPMLDQIELAWHLSQFQFH